MITVFRIEELPLSEPLLFVDFHGTISQSRYWEHLPEEEFKRIDRYLFHDNPDLLRGWMEGQITAEQICNCVAEGLSLDIGNLWNALVSGCSQFRCSRRLISALQQAKKHRPVVLLTENTDCLTRFVLPDSGLSECVDFVVNSAELHGHKESILVEIVQGRGSHSKDADHLIDDSSRVLELAKMLGLETTRTRSPQHTAQILRDLVSDWEGRQETLRKAA